MRPGEGGVWSSLFGEVRKAVEEVGRELADQVADPHVPAV